MSKAYLTNREIIAAIQSRDEPEIWRIAALLAERLAASYQRNREDLEHSGIIKVVEVMRSGKIDLSRNPFSFLTRCCLNEINRRVHIERHRAMTSLDTLL